MTGYSLGIANGGRITAEQLRAYAVAHGRADLVAQIDQLVKHGAHYSYEDFDILSRVWSALGWPRLDLVVRNRRQHDQSLVTEAKFT